MTTPSTRSLPREMARKAEEVGCAKVGMSAPNTFALAVLAGAFIAMGAIFATTVTPAARRCRTASRACSAVSPSRSA